MPVFYLKIFYKIKYKSFVILINKNIIEENTINSYNTFKDYNHGYANRLGKRCIV